MAPIDPSPLTAGEQKAWNEAADRLARFIDTFALNDRIHVSRLTLRLLDEARQVYERDKSQTPTTLVMEKMQQLLADWLAVNLGEQGRPRSEILASGYIALLLSRLNQTAPGLFLAAPLPDDLQKAMRQTLIETGPDLNVSSMTPRHLDYGPMLQLAQQTWHRFDLRATLTALIFWACVYCIFYWWLSELL